MRQITGNEQWQVFLAEAPPLAMRPTHAGDRSKQAKLAISLTSQTGRPLKAYGNNVILRELGKALPALLEHAQKPIFFGAKGELQPPKKGLFFKYRSRRKLAAYFDGADEFKTRSLRWETIQNIYDGFGDRTFALAFAVFSLTHPDEPHFLILPDKEHVARFSYPELFAQNGISWQDKQLYTAAHEASHARQQNQLDRFEKLPPAIQEHMKADFRETASFDELESFQALALEAEIDADRGAIEFTRRHPDLFMDPILDKAAIYRNIVVSLSNGIHDHATAVAALNKEPPAYGNNASFIEALKHFIAHKSLYHKLNGWVDITGKTTAGDIAAAQVRQKYAAAKQLHDCGKFDDLPIEKQMAALFIEAVEYFIPDIKKRPKAKTKIDLRPGS